MNSSEVTHADLAEAMRLRGQLDDAKHVQKACLERNGEISVIPRRRARVLEIEVAKGVQTVRIEVR